MRFSFLLWGRTVAAHLHINKKSLFRGYRHTSVEASMKERFHGEKCAGRGVESQDQVIRPSGMSGAAPDIPEGRILP